MTRSIILTEAEQVLEIRAEEYGPARVSLDKIAARWSQNLGCEVTPAQVVLCMSDLKMVRLPHDDGHRESLVDVIGSAVLMSEAQQSSNEGNALHTNRIWRSSARPGARAPGGLVGTEAPRRVAR